jgi:two-component system, LytTR family, sensor kinase
MVGPLRRSGPRCSVPQVQPRSIRPWILVSAVWILPAVLGSLDSLAQQGLARQPIHYRDVLFSGIDWLLYGLLTPFVIALSRRFPLARPIRLRNVAIHVAFALLFCFAWAGGGTLLKMALQPNSFDGGSIGQFYVSWVFTTFPFGAGVYFSIVGVEHALRYFAEARDREAQVARLADQLSSARLAALQARLNPHFLFNSLNTVNVLVRDGENAAATRVIEQLSDVLRTTLGRTRDSEVSLDDELALVRQYLAVEQARFSDRLRPTIDVPPSLLSAAVPSFALQHLVENAIRHGIARRSAAGQIAVSARRDGDVLEIEVRDDGGGLTGEPPAPGHGIENTRERLRTLYGDAATLELVPAPDQGAIARLRIPYREILLREARRDDDR